MDHNSVIRTNSNSNSSSENNASISNNETKEDTMGSNQQVAAIVNGGQPAGYPYISNKQWQYPPSYYQQSYSDGGSKVPDNSSLYSYYPQLQMPTSGTNPALANSYQNTTPYYYYNTAGMSQQQQQQLHQQQHQQQQQLVPHVSPQLQPLHNSPSTIPTQSSASSSSNYPGPKVYQYPGFQRLAAPPPPPPPPPQPSSSSSSSSSSSQPQRASPNIVPSNFPLRQFNTTPVGYQAGSSGIKSFNYVPSQSAVPPYDGVMANQASMLSPPSSANGLAMTNTNSASHGSTAKSSKRPLKKQTIETPKLSYESQVLSYDVTNAKGNSMVSYDINGLMTRPRVTTTMWEDEKTICFQVEANGVSVVRRADNDMINGTKLLNVAKITRGRRDGILKAERIRHVVKIGSMHLKGVWIPFERAHAMAQREKIVDFLYPLFVKDIQSVLRQTTSLATDGNDGTPFSRSNYNDDELLRQKESQAKTQQQMSFEPASWYSNMPNRQNPANSMPQPYTAPLSYGQYQNIPNHPRPTSNITDSYATPQIPAQFTSSYQSNSQPTTQQGEYAVPPALQERDSTTSASTISAATTSSSDSVPTTSLAAPAAIDKQENTTTGTKEEASTKNNTPGKILTGISPQPVSGSFSDENASIDTAATPFSETASNVNDVKSDPSLDSNKNL